jgi:phospholipid transport system transporter-binding protein
MSEVKLEGQGDGRYRIVGDLDFDTVPRLLGEGAAMFARSGDGVVVDLGSVHRTTSVGLALMVEWVRQARRANKTVTFSNVPAQMLAMARVSQLDALLKLEQTE